MRLIKMKLPDKPSELLMIALEDLEKIERDPRYTINMRTWHEPTYDPDSDAICQVCLAGAVMACRDGLAPPDLASPDDFKRQTRNKLYALNCFRMGDVSLGLETMGLGRVKTWLDMKFDHIEGSSLNHASNKPNLRPEWKLHMIDLIGILQAEGL